MKRTIDYHLLEWKNRSNRKPLLLRGARQVGKTHAARVLGQTFDNFIEINLEFNEPARLIFEKNLDPERIALQLSELVQTPIKPGSTLLFIDEIQHVPKAVTALRYFYELMPELHVVAAGSLLDFAIEQVGIPVGRVTALYVYPVSFMEFLVALGHKEWAKAIMKYTPADAISDSLHGELLYLVGIYIAIGGMPAAINEWLKTKISREVKIVHSELLFSYQQDFDKYAKKHQIKYLNLLFQKAIDQLARKFMFARVGEYKKRELEPALELLEKAGLFHKAIRSAGQGISIGAQAELDDFKIIFLDIGLSQAVLKFDLAQWFIDPLQMFINKGEIIEAFVGQEILAYSDSISKENLFYWRKDTRGGEAEVDYLVQLKEQVVPIVVKAGGSKRMQSMEIFQASHPNSSYGIRFWAHNYELQERIHSYPLYAVSKPFFDTNEYIFNAVKSLVA